MQKTTDLSKPTAPCQVCVRTRIFLAVSVCLIVAMPLLGDKATPLAVLTPMNIALSIVGIGSLAFIARWIAWRRDAARPQDTSPDTAEDA